MIDGLYETILSKFNHVYFREQDHSYFINDKEALYSATRLIKKWTPEFDSNKLAKLVAQKQGFLPEDILAKWDFDKNYSCFKGTIIHFYIENFLERKIVEPNNYEIKSFLEKYHKNNASDLFSTIDDIKEHLKAFKKFYDWWKEEHILIKSELVIGDKRLGGIGGMIDNLSYNTKTKKICFFDYKSNKEIHIKNKYKEKLLFPFNHLDNCELVKYSLQLLIYKKIFQETTNIQINSEDCKIIWLSKDGIYKLYDILPLEKEVETIFEFIEKEDNFL